MRDNVENLRMDVLRVHMFADTNAARLSSTDYVAIKQVASALGDVLAGTEQVSEKCATESIALLRKYNQWRCGVIDSFDGNEGPNPRAITEAINSVCADTEAIRARVAELEATAPEGMATLSRVVKAHIADLVRCVSAFRSSDVADLFEPTSREMELAARELTDALAAAKVKP